MKKNWHKGNITNNYRKFGAVRMGCTKASTNPIDRYTPVGEELQGMHMPVHKHLLQRTRPDTRLYASKPPLWA